MSEPVEDPTFPVTIVDNSGQLRTEVHYRGEGDPPWWSETGICQHRVNAAVQAVEGVEGVEHVHLGLTSSITLRLYVEVDRSLDRASVKKALIEALRDVVRTWL